MDNEKIIVIYACLQNDFLKRIIFSIDYNMWNEEYKEMLEEGKKIGKNEDAVMTEFILKDQKRINNTIDVIREYLYVKPDVEEPQIIDTFPKPVKEVILSACQKVLTPKEQEVYDIIRKNEFVIEQVEIAKRLGVTRQNISSILKRIRDKGYYIPTAQDMKPNRKKLSEEERVVLDIINEHNGDIAYTELSELSSTYSPSVLAKLKTKGYNVRDGVLNDSRLTSKQETLLKVNEENDYKITWENINKENKVAPETMQQLLKKFANTILSQEDAIRVAKFIKYKNQLPKLLKILRGIQKVSYHNMTILIDELLDGEENQQKAIDFIIEYEEILLEKGLKGVEKPMYQLLIKHKAQLNRGQCTKILELMDTYEERIKQDSDATEVVARKKHVDIEIE